MNVTLLSDLYMRDDIQYTANFFVISIILASVMTRILSKIAPKSIYLFQSLVWSFTNTLTQTHIHTRTNTHTHYVQPNKHTQTER